MANTSSHPITVNGVRLDTYAYNISVKDGWVNRLGRRNTNVVIPGRSGVLWTPNKRREEGDLILSMWVSHRDVDNLLATSDVYYNLRKNFDALVKIFDSSYDLLDVRHTIGNGEIRQAYCEVYGGFSPVFKGNLYGEFKVGLTIPSAFWQDVTPVTWSSPTSAAAIASHQVTSLDGATAPMEDLQFQVKGPITNPRLLDVKSGHSVKYTGTVPSGSTWEVDCGKWTSVVGTATAWAGTGVSNFGGVVANGIHRPRLFSLAPGSPPSVDLSGTGTGAATQLLIRSRRKFE